MNYTKKIDKKITYRENLIAEYEAEIAAARKAIETIQGEINVASEAGNYKLTAQKERQIRAAGEDLADSEKALEMALAKEKIPLQLIRDEWKNGPHADFLARRAKADAALDKAFKAFSDLAREAAQISEDCDREGDDWRELISEECNPEELERGASLNTASGAYNPSGIIREYCHKFEQENPRYN